MRSQPARPDEPGGIARDGQVGPILQDGLDQRSEDRPGSDFHEHPRTVAVHRLDHVGEPHGAGEMIAQPRRDRRRVGGVGGRIEVGVHRPVGRVVAATGSRAGPAARARRRPAAYGMRDETGKIRP